MSKHNPIAFEKPEKFSDPIHDLIQSGARQRIQSAIEVEVPSLLDTYQDEQAGKGHQAVGRNPVLNGISNQLLNTGCNYIVLT